jgi:hypothetical protein
MKGMRIRHREGCAKAVSDGCAVSDDGGPPQTVNGRSGPLSDVADARATNGRSLRPR